MPPVDVLMLARVPFFFCGAGSKSAFQGRDTGNGKSILLLAMRDARAAAHQHEMARERSSGTNLNISSSSFSNSAGGSMRKEKTEGKEASKYWEAFLM